ncbi:MAG: Rrf2 family transcriptional regulator [Desulfobulbaceae bacterium]|nr:Rrf2 family transcriptional regulator [Desulfobulbaceae bacterium]
MFRLSKKTEYAILAMQYLAEKSGEPVSAKEIATSLGLSFEFLSKSLQSLMKSGLVSSQQGIKGGYHLVGTPDMISVMDIIQAVSENVGIVECMTESDCSRSGSCNLKDPMSILQSKVNEVFTQTFLADFANETESNQFFNKDFKILNGIN